MLRREAIVGEGLVFMSGTPATVGGLTFGDRYELELEDPVLRRSLRHSYSVEVLPPGQQ